nr:hypothetical protein GCM10020241_56060 [Streptoalloteichus tenebrarius]
MRLSEPSDNASDGMKSAPPVQAAAPGQSKMDSIFNSGTIPTSPVSANPASHSASTRRRAVG